MATVIEQLIGRDGHRCVWCGMGLAAHGKSKGDRYATADHVIPKSKDGRNSIRNYVLACNRCNNRRGTTPIDEWMSMCLIDGMDVQRDLVEAALGRTQGNRGLRPSKRPKRDAPAVAGWVSPDGRRLEDERRGRVFVSQYPNECPRCFGVMITRSGMARFCPWCLSKGRPALAS